MATKKKSTSTNKKPTTKKVTKPVEEEVIKEDIKPIEIKEEKKEVKEIKKVKKHTIVNIFCIILFIVSLVSFIIMISKSTSIISLVSSLIITLFTIVFVVVSITYKRNSKSLILIGCLLLMCYFGLGFISTDGGISSVPNFTGSSVTEVIKWANKNSITVNQEYEYSDMFDEYSVISQKIVKKESSY